MTTILTKRFTLQLLSVICVLMAWQILADYELLNPLVLGSPIEVGRVAWSWVVDGSLWRHLASTLEILLAGYVIGLVVGIGIGALIGFSALAKTFLDPFLVFANSVPRIILVPFFITWLGFGLAPKIIIVALVVVFVVASNVEAGLREIQGDLISNVRMLGGSRWGLLRDVYIPGIALLLSASARTCMGYALQAAIVSEFFGSFSGLGYLIVNGQTSYDISIMYASLLVTIVLALMIDSVLALLERRVLVWLPSSD